MRHAILGAGAVGGLIGAVLARSGEDVTVLVRPQTEGMHPRELTLEGTFGDFVAPVAVTSRPGQHMDFLWVAVKATQLDAALETIPAGASIGTVIPLLNGIDHIPLLRQRFGSATVVPATIAVEAVRTERGKTIVRSPFVRLSLGESGHDRLQSVVERFSLIGFDCRFNADEITLMWSKLVFLAPVALSTSAADVSIGEIVGNPLRGALLRAAVREACTVAASQGAIVNEDAVIALIEGLPRSLRSSMQNDLSNGRVPELDAIAGPILRGAALCGIDVPAVSELVEKIRLKLGEP